MSKIFSVVSVYAPNECIAWGFRVPGFVRDEDDFWDLEDAEEMYEMATDCLEIEAQTYVFGDGESVRADDNDMKMLTEDFIDDECDCIEVNSFVVYVDEED